MRLERSCCPRSALVAVALCITSWLVSTTPAHAAGILAGPGMRLAGTHTFTFQPSGAGQTVLWSLDRETISSDGTRSRTNGIASRIGPVASFSLTGVSGSETIYYVNASEGGLQDVDTVQVFPANAKCWFTYRSPGNPDVRVYTVVPSTLNPATKVLLAMHGNSRTASSYADTWRAWAAEHDYIVLCPYYDEVNWPTDGMYQMGNVFSEGDCNGVMNPEERWTFTIDLGIHQAAREGFALADPLFDMWGFSGGGQHVHRFLLFKPNAPVRLAIAAGSGWYTVPDPAIDCPYGPDDPLTFSNQAVLNWTNRELVIMVGTEDTVRDEDLRTTARADAQGLNRYERAGYMMSKALAFNSSTRWRRIDVPDAAHESKPMALAAQSVLLGSVVGAPSRPSGAGPRPEFRVHPNPVAGGSSLSGEGWTGGEVKIDLYDLAGRRILSHASLVSDGKWRLGWRELAAAGRLAKGIYLVRVRDAGRHAEQKVMVLE